MNIADTFMADQITKMVSKLLNGKEITEVKQLGDMVKWLDDQYHNKNSSHVPDATYDALRRKYEELSGDSERVIPGNAGNVTHSRPMLSLRDLFSVDEVYDWLDRCYKQLGRNVPVLVEWKNDGLAVSLVYSKGRLQTAATRGNGNSGENVTTQVLTRMGKWGAIEILDDVEIRGEAVVTIDVFEAINAALEAIGQKPYSTERHAAAAVLRSKTGTFGKDCLHFVPYELLYADGRTLSQQVKFDKLAEMFETKYKPSHHTQKLTGYNFNPTGNKDTDLAALNDLIAQATDDRNRKSWLMDGLVFKIVDPEAQNELGMASSHPKWAIAFKFPPGGAESVLRDVKWQIGRTGVYTPVAVIDPVKVGGVIIESPTLHNFAEIKRLGVGIGSKVFLERRGDVIPKITKAWGEHTPVELPRTCMHCGNGLARVFGEKKGGISLEYAVCTNVDCNGKKTQAIIYGLNDDGLDIKGLGQVTIEKLVGQNVIRAAFDVFTLTEDKLINLGEMAPANAAKLMDAIEERRKGVELHRLITSLGVSGVGKTTSKELAAVAVTLERALTQLDVSPATVINLLNVVKNHNVTVLEGKSLSANQVCITGSLEEPRKEVEKWLSDNGFELKSSVSSKLKALIVGESPSNSKVASANNAGIPVVTFNEFKEKFVGK